MSFVDVKVASQLNSDDLKERRTGLADSLNIPQPSSRSWAGTFSSGVYRHNVCNEFWSRLDAEVPGVYPRAEIAEGRRALRR